MGAGLYVAFYDLVNLSMRKVILQPKSSRVVVYFHHLTLPRNPIFSASLDFHMRDKSKWYTHFEIHGAGDVHVDKVLEKRIETQMVKIFSPYFDSLINKERLW
jgi:hypothetical protein